MPKNFVLETSNAPGAGTEIPLAGSPVGYRPWLGTIGANVREQYVARGDNGQWEGGIGYVKAGPPATFVRETVLDGSSGPGVRVNFTAQVDVYNTILAERSAVLDSDGRLGIGGAPDRELSGPLDVWGHNPATNRVATFTRTDGTEVFRVAAFGVQATVPLTLDAATLPTHAARLSDVSNARIISSVETAVAGGINIYIPPEGTQFEITATLMGPVQTTTPTNMAGFISTDGATFIGANYGNQFMQVRAGGAVASGIQLLGAAQFMDDVYYASAYPHALRTSLIYAGGVILMQFSASYAAGDSARVTRIGTVELATNARPKLLRLIDGSGSGIRAGSQIALRRLN